MLPIMIIFPAPLGEFVLRIFPWEEPVKVCADFLNKRIILWFS